MPDNRSVCPYCMGIYDEEYSPVCECGKCGESIPIIQEKIKRDSRGRFLRFPNTPCKTEGCNNRSHSLGLCEHCYNKQHRQLKKAYYKKWQAQYYLKNIDKWREKNDERRIQQNIRYHSSPEENKKMNIMVCKNHAKYYRTNKEWKDKILRKTKKNLRRIQNISLKTASKNGEKWTISETDYLLQNYKKMTYLEIALKLHRTFCSIHAKRNELVPRKTRNLTNEY